MYDHNIHIINPAVADEVIEKKNNQRSRTLHVQILNLLNKKRELTKFIICIFFCVN